MLSLLLELFTDHPIALSLAALLAWAYIKCRAKYVKDVPICQPALPFLGNGLALKKAMDAGAHIKFYYEQCKLHNFQVFQWSVPGTPGINGIMTCLPDHVDHMFSRENFETWIKGEQFQELFEETLGHGIFAVDGEEWREKRKVSSYLFSAKTLREHMSSVFADHAVRVLDLLKGTPAGQPVDVQQLFLQYTFDSISKIAFGLEVDSLGGNPRDVAFQRAYDEAQSTNSQRMNFPGWKLARTFGIGREGDLQKHVDTINAYVMQIIDERLEQIKSGCETKGDMLSLYIQYGLKKEKTYNKKYLRDMILNFIIAGRDTTAAASMWMIYELSRHPQFEQDIINDIQSNAASGQPTFDEVANMHFIKAFFYETLRLHPSVPLDGKFAARDCYLEPGHIYCPKGTLLHFNIYAMNRDPSRWAEPNQFRPSRFLDAEGQFIQPKESDFPTFNRKPRFCLGSRMAEFEAAMLLCTLVPNVKLRLQEGFEPIGLANAILLNSNGMMVTVESRS